MTIPVTRVLVIRFIVFLLTELMPAVAEGYLERGGHVDGNTGGEHGDMPNEAGRHWATYTYSHTIFQHTNWIGTEQVHTLADGSVGGTCTVQAPFGEWASCSGYYTNDPSPMFFTGKEYDNWDGLSNFGARYYYAFFGRFLTADWADKPEAVPYSDLADPQSLNLYTYVRNNPVSRTDVDGHECPVCDEVSQELVDSVVSPLIQSAETAGSTAVSIGCRIFCGAVGVVYSLTVGAEPLGTANEAERAHKARESQQSKQDEESKDAQPEPKPSTEGASAAKGGGKNDRKINQQRKQSAQDKIASLRQQRDALESKANKTPADKEALAKINNQLKREIDRQRKSETHSRRHKGTLE